LGTPELATLEQDRNTVVQSIREGFAAAFDLFAPAIGVHIPGDLTGLQVAEIVFPNSMLDDRVLEKQVRVRGDEIHRGEAQASLPQSKKLAVWAFSVRNLGRKWRRRRQGRRNAAWMQAVLRGKHRGELTTTASLLAPAVAPHDPPAPPPTLPSFVDDDDRDDDASKALLVLAYLPGLQHGRMAHLARNLHVAANSSVAA
jgi:hypothetical protein